MTKRIVFCDTSFFEQINHIRTAVPGHAQLSLKCRLPNCINSDLLTGGSAKFKRGHVQFCAEHLGGLAVTNLPGVSHPFNLALTRMR